MIKLFRRGVSLLVLLALVLSFLPMVPRVSAANLSTDIYQLPSMTLNDAGTKYRQNMSYIIRTRNGKIIVIDGGYSYDNVDSNYLISQLQTITGKEVPNVDAWFLTHDHADHVGCFKAIAARLREKLTVTAVYYRFPTEAEIDKYAPEASRASLKSSVQAFRAHVALMKKDDGTPTDTVTLSARHVNRCNGSFVIDTVQIDVLMTCQEVFWGCDNITTKYSGNLSNNGKAYTSQTIKQLVEADFGNNTSTVFRLTTMGQSAIFLGDAAEPAGLMLKYFHDQNAANSNKYFSLKSDIVQMAHHGQNAVPKSVYVAIAPKIALWPAPDWVYTPSSSSELTTNYTKQWMSELGVTNYVSKDGLKKISINDLRTDAQPVVPEELKPLIFDPTYYTTRYPDVKNAFGSDEAKLYNHFLQYGIEEGRCASHYFDIKFYMSQNSAKMADYCKGDYEKGFAHFLKYAYLETELTGGGAKKLSAKFDCKYYYNNYPILKELGLKNEFEILQYYVTTGKAAGHQATAEMITLDKGITYHSAKLLPAVAATCTAEGKTAGKQCSICGLILAAQTPVAKLSHTAVTDKAVAATCTTAGKTEGSHCSVCNAVIQAQTTIPATGHTPVTDKAVAATCTTAGKTEGSHCSVCNAVIKAQTTVPATGHSYTSKVTTAATCTKAGVKTFTCSKCNHSYTEALAATGHTPVTDKAVAATCTTAGKTEGSHCSVCNAVIQAQTTVPATGHTPATDKAVAATCTTAGKTEGSHCAVCHAVLVKQDTIPALGHDHSYTDNGDGTHTGTCSRCKDVLTEGHKFEGDTCFCGGKVVTVDESIRIYHTLDLASDISITFAVPQTALADYDSFYLECILPEYEGNTLTGASTARIGPIVNGSYYYFTLTGITAVRMGDMVSATLHMTRGTAQYISAVDTYSVATYAYGMLNSTTDSKMLTLCADLLRYGAEAQSFKKYRTNALVDVNMTDVHRSYLSNTEALTFNATDSYLGDLASPKITWVGKTLDLGSKVGMKFVFNTKNYSGDIANLSMKVSYTGSNGETKTVTLTGAEAYNAANGYYSFTFYGLLASELRTVVDVAVYEGSTQLTETLRYSAESYASKNTTGALGDLCKALFAYSDSAKAYFTK